MRLILMLAASLMLVACGGIVSRAPQPSVAQFDLGPPAETIPADAHPWRLSISSAIAVDSTAMRYRFLHADPAKVMNYSRSRWVSAPGEVLRRRLELQLFWPAGSPVSTCTVNLELQKFEQVFTGPDTSKGLLAVRAELRQRGGRILDERYFIQEADAPSADASGGVAALGLATDQLVNVLREWQKTGMTKEQWSGCWE
ncbi:MAG: ABC-type transport auxiliary lipoprotein family protein [Azovibrio sp.]